MWSSVDTLCPPAQGSLIFHHDKKDSLTFCWFASNIEPTRHSTQRSQWPLESDCDIETRYTNISVPVWKSGGTLWFSGTFGLCATVELSTSNVLSWEPHDIGEASTQGTEIFLFKSHIQTPAVTALVYQTFWYHLRLSFHSLACLGCTDSNWKADIFRHECGSR